MKKAVLANRIYINRTKELHDKFLKDLHYILPPIKPGLPPQEACDVTRINKDILTIPIGRLDLIPSDYEVVDKRITKPIVFPEFSFTLRPSQQEVLDNFNDSAILCANPSYGKTFTAIAIARKLSQKTLVIVHTEYLRDQWVKEINKTLRISPGIVGGGKFNIDSPITIANIQTLRNKVVLLQKEFGTIITDECHHIPANVFKSIVDNFNARYKIGLTATPWRKDGRHVMLYDYLGGPEAVHKPLDENSMTPMILAINSEIALNSNPMMPWGLKLNDLYKNNKYMELVLNLSHIQMKKGHFVLSVADRVEFLQTCAKVIEDSVCVTGITEDRDALIKSTKLIFGSSKIFSEGINIPALSSLILGMPVNNRTLLDQLIGRICRPCEGKLNPEVIDIILSGKTGKNQFTQRVNYYTEKEYKIRYIQ